MERSAFHNPDSCWNLKAKEQRPNAMSYIIAAAWSENIFSSDCFIFLLTKNTPVSDIKQQKTGTKLSGVIGNKGRQSNAVRSMNKKMRSLLSDRPVHFRQHAFIRKAAIPASTKPINISE